MTGTMKTFEYLEEDVREQLIDLMDGDVEDIIDLIETLEETNPMYHDQLSESLISHDANGVRNAAHALKSAYAQIGALEMSHIMRDIEAAGKSGDITTVPGLFKAAQAEELNVRQAFASWKENLLNG